jgi:hypothetical protein
MQLVILASLLMMFALQGPVKRPFDLLGRPIPVAVLCNGDDGLTSRLCDQVKEIFSKSRDFTLEVANKPRILIVRIPTNVEWKKVDGRAKALYRVEFSVKDEHDVRTSAGSCREDDLKSCAAKIFVGARNRAGITIAVPGPHRQQ